MAVDATSVIEIRRPRDEVAAFVEDFANDKAWIRALVQPAEVLSAEVFPWGVGARVRRVAKMAGARIDYTTEIVEYRRGETTVMKSVTGPAMVVTYSFYDSPAGTTVQVRNQGAGGVMFTMFGWVMSRMVKSRVDGDLWQLKQVLETDTSS